jgi:hypothetical protein
MCFSAAASSENDHGSMNLASKHARLADQPSRVAAIQGIDWWMACLDIVILCLSSLVPAAVEVFCHQP